MDPLRMLQTEGASVGDPCLTTIIPSPLIRNCSLALTRNTHYLVVQFGEACIDIQSHQTELYKLLDTEGDCGILYLGSQTG
jgi:hypothetical protein